MRRFTVVLIALLILSGHAFAKCYQVLDGSFICIYSKTGVARFSYHTYKKLTEDRGSCNSTWVYFVKPRISNIREMWKKAQNLHEREMYWALRVFAGRNRPTKIYMENGCKALGMIESGAGSHVTGESAAAWGRTLELWGESPRVSPEAGVVLLGLSAALKILSMKQESAVKSNYLVDKGYFDVNELLEEGKYVYWFSLRKDVTESEFRMLIEDPPYKTKEISRYLKLTRVFFRHNEHLNHVPDCSRCHHTGDYVSCGTCHGPYRISNPYDLMYKSWYAIGKLCTKCHADFDRPVPWNCEGLTEKECVTGARILFRGVY